MTMSPQRVQTLLQLNDQLLSKLDRAALRSGESRSALVRRALGEWLAQEMAKEADARLAESYRRQPDTGEFDALAAWSVQQSVDEEPW
ncbi:MAG: ribbon-helix-helix protein, CopG family [Thermoleophilia bacterium]|nr:ribbon-helix-helix protein, CopG family [Thermoleophilia bacterium]